MKGVDASTLTKESIVAKAKAANVDMPEGYPIDMHKIYVTWALWGFWTNAIMITTFFVAAIMVCIKPKLAAIMGVVNGLGWIISTCLWLTFGAIWRYSYGGSVAAGDKLVRDDNVSDDDWKTTIDAAAVASGYQIKSGKFLAVVFGIVTGILMLMLIAFAVAGCLMCVCGMDADSINKMAANPLEADRDNSDESKPLTMDDGTEQER